jgi:PAS domain-containing protein
MPDMHGDRLHSGIAMTTSSNSSGLRSESTAQRPASTGGRDESVGVHVRSTEFRRRPPTGTPEAHLHELPALVLLDRLAIPMLAVRLDGVVVYTNPALATMLGHHPNTVALIGRPLSELLAGRSATPALDCVAELRATGTMVVDWLHAEGFAVRSVISETVFVRATDQILLIGITDITELMWTIHRES